MHEGGLVVSTTQPESVDAVFAQLGERSLDRCYSLAGYLLGDATEAEDATQEAMARAWKARRTLRDGDAFEGWLDRILVNTCRNRLRSSRWQATDISAEVVAVSGDQFGRAHDRDVVGKAIAGLSPDHQVVVALRFYRDLPIEEIAVRLGIPAGTVQSRLHYALQRLHVAIDAAGSKGTVR